MRHRALLGAILFALLAATWPGRAELIATDTNIVTAVDISDSVGAADLRQQIAGIAAAVRSPNFLAAVRRGRQGRIGFTVFTWYHGHFPVAVAWRVIGSEADVLATAREIDAWAEVDVASESWSRDRFYAGRLTNLAGAIDRAREILATAPFPAGHDVVNVIGNGADNVGGDVAAARARLVATGATVNGLVVGGDAAVADYYRRNVAGGSGAFVMDASVSSDLVEAMHRKFAQDLVAAALPAAARW